MIKVIHMPSVLEVLPIVLEMEKENFFIGNSVPYAGFYPSWRGGTGLGGIPTHVPHVPQLFCQKNVDFINSCSFWPFCPNPTHIHTHTHTNRPHLENSDMSGTLGSLIDE